MDSKYSIMNSDNNLVWHHSHVSRSNREDINHHKSVVIWFTGLSGAGKSTLAHAVEKRLHDTGCRTFVLDGDNVRHGLSADLGFGDQDRQENIRRIGEAAKLMMEAGIITMTAFISPFRADRDKVRSGFAAGDFIEVYCQASLDTCEARDVKGLYKKARAGEIKNYTGIDSPYEAPFNPELIIDTGNTSVDQCVEQVVFFLNAKGIIS